MNKGNSEDGSFPKFFKVYLPDESGDDLALPLSFNSLLPTALPKNVIVRSIYGNVWKLELRKCWGDNIEKFVMVDGWKRIVKDEDLTGGEFLVFEFDGSRLFNFCIYGHTTCKRLRSLVQTRENEDESDDENDKSSDDIIVISSDEDEADDDDQEYSDENKSREDIIVLSDDDSDDDDDDDGDGDDDVNDVQDYGDEDKSIEDIIVLDDEDSGDGDYAEDDQDDGNERRRGVETERKEKGSSRVSQKSDDEDDRQYLDDDMNPFFKVNLGLRRKINLSIPAKVVNTYDLHFPEFINLIDSLGRKLGKLKRKVESHTIKGFESIIKRNRVKSSDKMICELERERNGLVYEIKVHVISG